MRYPHGTVDPKVVRAYEHPVRARAMELLEARVARPTDIATLLGEPLGAVAYHVRRLQELGLVELVERARRRGATEHYYTGRGPTITDVEWEKLTIPQRRAVIAGGLQRLAPPLGAAASRGGFHRDGAHVELIPLRLGATGWRLAAQELRWTFERIEAVAEAAKLRAHEHRMHTSGHAFAVLSMSVGAQLPDCREQSKLEPIDLVDPRMITAMSHPLRAEIFRLLRERRASPSGLAKATASPVGITSYHVRRLAELGLIELVGLIDKGSSVEHYYAAAVTPTILDERWPDLITDSYTARIARLLATAARGGGFDADDIHLTRTPFSADPETWDDMVELLGDVRVALTGLTAARDESEAADRQTFVTTMLFEYVGSPPAGRAPNPAAAPASPR
jgi:DNA-binding transcriptional ArsR family regulator